MVAGKKKKGKGKRRERKKKKERERKKKREKEKRKEKKKKEERKRKRKREKEKKREKKKEKRKRKRTQKKKKRGKDSKWHRRCRPPQGPPRSGPQWVTFRRSAMANAIARRRSRGARKKSGFLIFVIFDFLRFFGAPSPRPGYALCF